MVQDNELNLALQSAFNWESLEPTLSEEDKVKSLELDNEIFKAFRSGSGKYVLNHLINVYLTKPIVRPGDDAYSCGIREGRADLVRQILKSIENAKQGENK